MEWEIPTEIDDEFGGSEVEDLGDNWGLCSKEGVLLEWRPMLFDDLFVNSEIGTGGPSSKEDSKRPEAEVRGFGGGAGGVWGCWFWCCFFSFWTSSDVNCTVEVLPPRNFSQPGAPDDEITKISTT